MSQAKEYHGILEEGRPFLNSHREAELDSEAFSRSVLVFVCRVAIEGLPK